MMPADAPVEYVARMKDAAEHIRVGLYWVTKSQGQLILAHCNDHNRRMTHTWRKIAGALQRMGIQVNGETIAFSRTGRLLNGQNRIQAVISTGVPFPTMGVWGIPDEAFPTYDSGKIRSASDVLGIAKYQHTHILASAITWQLAYESMPNDKKAMERPKKSVPNDQVVELAMAYPELVESVKLCGKKYRRLGFSPSLGAFLHHEFSKRDKQLATQFFDRVMCETMVPEVSHEKILIRRLKSGKPDDGEEAPKLRNKRNNKAQEFTPVMLAAITIKTWNNIRCEVPPKANSRIFWSDKEDFPEIM